MVDELGVDQEFVLQLLERAEGSQDVWAILETASDELRRDRDLVLVVVAKSVRGVASKMVVELGVDREFVLQLLERAKGGGDVNRILEKASYELRCDRDLVLAVAAKSVEGAAKGMAAALGADREFVLQLLEWARDGGDVEYILGKASYELRRDRGLVLAAAVKSIAGVARGMVVELRADREFVAVRPGEEGRR